MDSDMLAEQSMSRSVWNFSGFLPTPPMVTRAKVRPFNWEILAVLAEIFKGTPR
jgi:hypothetical protein